MLHMKSERGVLPLIGLQDSQETEDGLLIKPIQSDEVVYYKAKDGFGLYCEKGLPVDKIIAKIKDLHGSNRKVPKKSR